MIAEIRLETLSTADQERIAQIHCAAFPSSAITGLGKEAVRRYYEWLLVGPHDCHPRGAYEGDTLVGYCFGGVFRGALSGYVRANRVYLGTRLICRPHMLFNAEILHRIKTACRILFPGRKTGPAPKSEPVAHGGWFGVLSIAVDPKFQGQGIGKRLIDDAEMEAKRRGNGRMRLTVDPLNEKAVRFYERLGWKQVSENDGWNGRMHKMVGT